MHQAARSALPLMLTTVLAMSAATLPTPLFAEKRAETCDPATVSAMLDQTAKSPIHLSCSVTLPKGSIVYRNVILEGSSASGVTLDCNGSTIDTSRGSNRAEKTAVVVRSKQAADGHWDAPQSATVKNCTIKGFVRVYGLNENAGGANMHASSMHLDHTKFARTSAPKRIRFLNLSIEAPGGISLYIGPGVTWTTLSSSTLTGQTVATAIYIDAESGWNSIIENRFSIKTKHRELIAIDGSTRNEIVGNVFENPVNGGIFVYRNCGENGTIRHQKPELNTISNNTFSYVDSGEKAKPAVWLGSRGGTQKYCFKDPQHPFGSSANPMDFAQKNTVEHNHIVGGGFNLIRNSDPSNIIRNNTSN